MHRCFPFLLHRYFPKMMHIGFPLTAYSEKSKRAGFPALFYKPFYTFILVPGRITSLSPSSIEVII